MRMRTAFVAAFMMLATATAAPTLAKPAKKAVPRVDLAELVAGTYQGDVISDARGSSRNRVGITVEKIAPNSVRVSSSYKRIPTRTFTLEKVMNTIQNKNQTNNGLEVFLADLSKAGQLDLTIDDASWSGRKQAAAADHAGH